MDKINKQIWMQNKNDLILIKINCMKFSDLKIMIHGNLLFVYLQDIVNHI
jgi:hypothetical protein